MPGLKGNELMHEWMREDTPFFDIPAEEITMQLVHDNEIMLRLIQELGAETELRKRLDQFSSP